MIQRPGLTFALCLSALFLGSTALSAQGPDDLAAQLAMPTASNLAGARDVPRFAWIENAAGARNLWVGGPDMVAHALTNNGEDDGVELSDVTLSNDGTSIAFVRGGDSEYPDGSPPNTGNAASTPRPPRLSIVRPISSEITVPPVRTAMSPRLSFWRSPKPGALTARILMVPRSLLTARVASASPSRSPQMMTMFLETWRIFSRTGRISWTEESFLSVMRM